MRSGGTPVSAEGAQARPVSSCSSTTHQISQLLPSDLVAGSGLTGASYCSTRVKFGILPATVTCEPQKYLFEKTSFMRVQNWAFGDSHASISSAHLTFSRTRRPLDPRFAHRVSVPPSFSTFRYSHHNCRANDSVPCTSHAATVSSS